MLVGHSMGGMTIMALADQRPELFAERVFGVALIATTAGGLARGQPGPAAGARARTFHRLAPAVAAASPSARSCRVVALERQRPRPAADQAVLVRIDRDRRGEPFRRQHGRCDADRCRRGVPARPAGARQARRLPRVPVRRGPGPRRGHRPAHAPELQRVTSCSLVPGADYVVVPDSGHMVTLEKHEEVDAAPAGAARSRPARHRP